MLGLYKYVCMKNMNFHMEKYKNEFDDIVTYNNIEKCEKLGYTLFIINILLVLVDLVIYKPMRSETMSYLYLFYLHIFMLILILFWFKILKLEQNSGNVTAKKLVYFSFLNIMLYWTIFLCLNGINDNKQISVYILCNLVISIFIYLTPLEAFITYFISLVVFIIGLTFVVDNTKVFYSYVVNSCVVVLLSNVLSNFNFILFSKDFINKKELLNSKIELEATNRKLKESEKLRTDFFANISHELKTPLNVIYCAQQMMDFTLKQDQYNYHSMNKYLNMVKQNSFRLMRLIENLIDITKIDALSFYVKPVNADIINLVENITMSVATFVENKGLSLTFDTVVEEKIISCDPDQIERIVLNLLSNAVKFTEDGGSIFVNIYLQDNKVCISIKDTGIGIPNDMKDLIFGRFIQVDKSTSKKREGSGIGLALVKSLVEMHGGSIHVNSKLNKGSEFIIMLPDTVITENEKAQDSSSTNEDYIKKINIEFSDIYE